MSSLESLEIVGIRSFPDNSCSTIKFYRPLTIIVGKNGTGKTTIIECLKYACTGILPPASRKGQAFVQDTKVANKSVVRAKVELEVITTKGKHLKISRSVQLEQKKEKQTFQTLNTSISFRSENGEVRSHSESTYNVNYIPSLIGVSSSILENVVFCHQEESNWPLQDDSKQVKKRFDEIFSSTRYTKALDHIESKRKEYNKLIATLKAELKTQQVIRDNYYENKKSISDVQSTIETLQQSVTKNRSELDQYASSMKKLRDVIDANSSKKKEIESMKQRLEVVRSELESIELFPLRLDLTEEELDNEIESKKLKTDQDSQKLELYAKKIEGIKSEKRQLEDVLLENEKKELLIKSKKENLDLKLIARDEAVKVYYSKYKMKDAIFGEIFEKNAQFDDVMLNRFLEIGNNIQIAAKLKMEELATKSKNKLRVIELNLNRLNEQKTRLMTILESKNEQIDCTKREIEELRNSVSNEASVLGDNESISARYEELKKEVDERESLMVNEDYKTKIGNALLEYQRLKEDNQVALEKINAWQEVFCEIKNLSDVKCELDTELRSIVEEISQGEYGDTVILGEKTLREWVLCFPLEGDYGDVLFAFYELLAEKTVQLSEKFSMAKSQSESIYKDIQGFETLRSSCIEDLKGFETLMKVEELSLKSYPKDKTAFFEMIKRFQNDYDGVRFELARLVASMSLYEDFLDDAQSKKICPLCKSDLYKAYKMNTFENSVNDLLNSFPEKIATNNEKNKIIKNELDQLYGVQANLEVYITYKNRIEEENIKIETLNSQIKSKKDLYRTLHDNSVEEEKKFEYFQKLFSRLENFMEKIKFWKTKMEQSAIRQLKCGYDGQVFEILDIKRKKLESMMSEKETLIKNMESTYQNLLETNRISVKELKEVELSLLTLNSYNNSKMELIKKESELQLLESNRVVLENDISQKISEIQELNKRLQSDLKMFDIIEKKNYKDITDAYCDLNLIREKQDEILNLKKDISKEEVLKESEKRDFLDSVKKLDFELKNLEDEHEKFKAFYYSTDEIQSVLKRTRHYRDLQRGLMVLKSELDARERQITPCIGGSGANPEAEMEALNKKFCDFKSNIDQTIGQIMQLKAQEDHFERVVNNTVSTHGDVDLKYKEALVRLETVQKLVSDLKIYHFALENAVMKYHTQKMESINQMIQELWESIYKGQDIDYLRISTDNDEVEGVKNTRAFQYRIMMNKNGVELEMKGRCSTGQKVLASIIIRMALAETFGINCGVLALDEPTTNLDRTNVESLASSLARLIKRRESQSNFQLLVITHDEVFVRQLMQEHQTAEYYWKISKKGQQSHIRRMDIKYLNRN